MPTSLSFTLSPFHPALQPPLSAASTSHAGTTHFTGPAEPASSSLRSSAYAYKAGPSPSACCLFACCLTYPRRGNSARSALAGQGAAAVAAARFALLCQCSPPTTTAIGARPRSDLYCRRSTDLLLFAFVHAGCAHVSLAPRTSQRLTSAYLLPNFRSLSASRFNPALHPPLSAASTSHAGTTHFTGPAESASSSLRSSSNTNASSAAASSCPPSSTTRPPCHCRWLVPSASRLQLKLG